VLVSTCPCVQVSQLRQQSAVQMSRLASQRLGSGPMRSRATTASLGGSQPTGTAGQAAEQQFDASFQLPDKVRGGGWTAVLGGT
jgi:hypothetical protein